MKSIRTLKCRIDEPIFDILIQQAWFLFRRTKIKHSPTFVSSLSLSFLVQDSSILHIVTHCVLAYSSISSLLLFHVQGRCSMCVCVCCTAHDQRPKNRYSHFRYVYYFHLLLIFSTSSVRNGNGKWNSLNTPLSYQRFFQNLFLPFAKQRRRRETDTSETAPAHSVHLLTYVNISTWTTRRRVKRSRKEF